MKARVMPVLVRFSLVIYLLIACYSVTFAQPCGTPGLPPCDPGDPVPITGFEILLLGGAALGVRHLRRKFFKQK